MVLEVTPEAAFVIGLIGVAFAIIQRALKPYLEEKAIAQKAGQDLPFNGAYATNALLTVLGAVTLVLGALSQLTESVSTTTSGILALGIGYTFTYTLIDQLNKRTEKKEEIAEIKAQIPSTTTTKPPTPTPPT